MGAGVNIMTNGITYIGMLIFIVAFFGVFASMYTGTDIRFTEDNTVTVLYNETTGTVYAGEDDTSLINGLKDSIDFKDAGVFGDIIGASILLFIGFIALYYARGTN